MQTVRAEASLASGEVRLPPAALRRGRHILVEGLDAARFVRLAGRVGALRGERLGAGARDAFPSLVADRTSFATTTATATAWPGRRASAARSRAGCRAATTATTRTLTPTPARASFSPAPAKGSGRFDFNCDGNEEQQSTAALPSCATASPCKGEGWAGTVPGCGEQGQLRKLRQRGRLLHAEQPRSSSRPVAERRAGRPRRWRSCRSRSCRSRSCASRSLLGRGQVRYRAERALSHDDENTFTAIESSLAFGLSQPDVSLLIYHRDGCEMVGLHEGKPLVVGRARPADVPIRDSSLSRQHARFTLEAGTLWVEDLESTNGTRLNGKKIGRRTKVKDRDEVKLGGVTIGFHRRDAASRSRSASSGWAATTSSWPGSRRRWCGPGPSAAASRC